MTLQHNLAETFYDNLPKRPWAANDLSYGLQHYARRYAAKRKYIQPNPPFLLNAHVFDLDRPDAFGSWEDANLPEPNIYIGNPKNGHGHLIYNLATPVARGRNARPGPLRLAEATWSAFNDKLGGDRGYRRLICKNPLHGAWKTVYLHDFRFPLLTLADYVDLACPAPVNQVQEIGGRNCTLFDDLRMWAYGVVHAYCRQQAWDDAVLAHADRLNTFPVPLPYSEVKATAKSVAGWVYDHKDFFIPGERYKLRVQRGRDGHGKTRHDTFDVHNRRYREMIPKLDTQEKARRQVLSAQRTSAAKPEKTKAKIAAVIETLLDQAGNKLPTKEAIAKMSGVSERSVYTYYPELLEAIQRKAA